MLDLRIIQRPEVDTHDWSSIDEKKFRTRLVNELQTLRCPKTKTLLAGMWELVAVMQAAINYFHAA
jgi:hypothetical protein